MKTLSIHLAVVFALLFTCSTASAAVAVRVGPVRVAVGRPAVRRAVAAPAPVVRPAARAVVHHRHDVARDIVHDRRQAAWNAVIDSLQP